MDLEEFIKENKRKEEERIASKKQEEERQKELEKIAKEAEKAREKLDSIKRLNEEVKRIEDLEFTVYPGRQTTKDGFRVKVGDFRYLYYTGCSHGYGSMGAGSSHTVKRFSCRGKITKYFPEKIRWWNYFPDWDLNIPGKLIKKVRDVEEKREAFDRHLSRILERVRTITIYKKGSRKITEPEVRREYSEEGLVLRLYGEYSGSAEIEYEGRLVFKISDSSEDGFPEIRGVYEPGEWEAKLKNIIV